MVQFRRLDPLANAGPWQRGTKRAVKTFTLSEEQFDWVAERRPELIVSEDEGILLARPYRNFLEIHYAYPDVSSFRTQFKDMLTACLEQSSRQEAPRGVVLSFRDRPNRPLAKQLFWEIALVEGKHWAEFDYTSVPEQPEPQKSLEAGFTIREATANDRDAIASIEAEATGLPRLDDAGVDSVYESARWLHVVEDGSSKPVAWFAMNRGPAGWGLIEEVFVLPSEEAALREPLARWMMAFLRNNGGRRQRRRVYLDDTENLGMMRSLGYSAAESGVDYTRPVEASDIQVQVEERQSHGTIIKFGNWR